MDTATKAIVAVAMFGLMILAFAMFGIDEIGVEIEDPFGYDANDLPLDAIGNRIAEDTRAILAQRDPDHVEWPL